MTREGRERSDPDAERKGPRCKEAYRGFSFKRSGVGKNYWPPSIIDIVSSYWSIDTVAKYIVIYAESSLVHAVCKESRFLESRSDF